MNDSQQIRIWTLEVSYIHAFHVIHDPDDDRWKLVHERHRIERSRNDLG